MFAPPFYMYTPAFTLTTAHARAHRSLLFRSFWHMLLQMLMNTPHMHVQPPVHGRGSNALANFLSTQGTELCVSLENVFEEHCLGVGKNPSALLQLYRERIKDRPAPAALPAPAAALTQFYNEAKTFVPDNLLLAYVLRQLAHPSHLFLYKKQFAQQLAMKSLLGFLFSVGDRTADKFTFLASTVCAYALCIQMSVRCVLS